MERKTSFFMGMLLFATVLFSCTEKQNVLTDQEKVDGWKLLFDGQSLNGWKNYNEPGITGWSAQDGNLASSGTGSDSTGYIITDKKYDNFELAFDWKIAAEGNSGVWTSAPEYGLSETGYISLQDHGSKAWFRNMKIKELSKTAKPKVALFNGVDLTGWIAYLSLIHI